MVALSKKRREKKREKRREKKAKEKIDVDSKRKT